MKAIENANFGNLYLLCCTLKYHTMLFDFEIAVVDNSTCVLAIHF